LIYGLNKSQWHLKARSKEEFSEFLLDYYSALLRGFEKPKVFIHLMDAVMGMEGEGPGAGGTPRKIGAVLAGQDAVSVDAVATRVVGLPLKEVLTVTLGERRGLGTGAFERIELLGADLDAFQIRDYVPTRASGGNPMGHWPLNTRVLKDLLVEKPAPSKERCTLCYQCKAICPGGAISESQGESGVPSYDYDKCIRCYCCMEICPEAAIRLKKGKLQWLVNKWSK
jgi:Pyruvate/2-oxoacid:ferredoxin oxidoreductase delta subunit